MHKPILILLVFLLIAGCDNQKMTAEERVAAQREFLCAAEDGDIDKVKELLASGIDIKFKYSSALLSVVENNHPDMVKLLIKSGADVNIKCMEGYPLLRHANSIEILQILIDNGADVNAKGKYDKTVLQGAIGDKRFENVKMLIEGGADVDIKDDIAGQTALHWAMKGQQIKIIELLIRNGADVNARDKKERTPLDFAVDRRDEKAAVLLREAGAEHGIGRKLLHAAGKGDFVAVRELINQGADIDVKMDHYWRQTPLIRAIEARNKETVELLIVSGADVNCNSKYGLTALHEAVHWSIDIVKILIAYGADVNARGGLLLKTPLDMAKSEEMKELLRYHGALTGEELEEKEQEK